MCDKCLTIWGGAMDGVANVRDYGARGDDKGSDSEAIQKAIDATPGPVYFPPGRYVIDEPVVIAKPGVTLFGLNNAKHVPGCVRIDCPTRAEPAIRIKDDFSGCRLAGLYLYEQREAGTKPSRTIIQVEGGDKYYAGLTLENVAIIKAGRGLVFSRTGTNGWIGHVRLYDESNIASCNQAIVCEDIGITNLAIRDCCIRQNVGELPSGELVPVINLRGYLLSIEQCTLEGQPRTLRVTGGRAVSLLRCYFEGNSQWLASFIRCQGIDVRGNFWRKLGGENYGPWRTVDCQDMRLDPLTVVESKPST